MKRTPLSRSRKPPTRAPLKRKRRKVSVATRMKRAGRIVMEGAARDAVFERDEFRCQRCGRRDQLQWHHVVRRSRDVRLKYELDNGLTLCNGCHRFWWHADEHAAMNWFIENWPERNEHLMKLRGMPR